MLILYDFTCHDCGHTDEYLVPKDTDTTPCKECQGNAARIISPVRFSLPGWDSGYPTAADKWARQHEKAGKQPVEE